jgi:hypothetical protein
MKRFPTALMLYAACAALFCSRHPSGPTADPSDAAIELFAGGTNCTVETGTPLKMGLAVSHPLFIDTIHLTSSCGGFDTTLSPDLVETADTLYFNLVFTRGGACAVYAKAILYGAHYGEKTDSLSVEVRAKPPTVTLLVAPLIFAPTKDRFEVNAVAADGDPKTLRLFVQRSVDKGWTEVETARYPAFDIAEWSVTDLSPGTVYPYAIVTEEDALKALEGVAAEPGTDGTPHPGLLFLGKAVTQREPGESFRFALIADTHLRPHEVTPGLDIWAVEEGTLLSVVKDIKVNHPDFIIHLGDVLDFHDYGFNDPPPSGDVTRWGYLNYRRMLGDMIGNTAHFMVIGNWDGESGDYSEDEIDRSREQRLLYAPGPEPSTIMHLHGETRFSLCST